MKSSTYVLLFLLGLMVETTLIVQTIIRCVSAETIARLELDIVRARQPRLMVFPEPQSPTEPERPAVWTN